MAVENPGSQQFLNSDFECRVQQDLPIDLWVSPIIPWGFHFFLLSFPSSYGSLLPSNDQETQLQLPYMINTIFDTTPVHSLPW